MAGQPPHTFGALFLHSCCSFFAYLFTRFSHVVCFFCTSLETSSNPCHAPPSPAPSPRHPVPNPAPAHAPHLSPALPPSQAKPFPTCPRPRPRSATCPAAYLPTSNPPPTQTPAFSLSHLTCTNGQIEKRRKIKKQREKQEREKREREKESTKESALPFLRQWINPAIFCTLVCIFFGLHQPSPFFVHFLVAFMLDFNCIFSIWAFPSGSPQGSNIKQR